MEASHPSETPAWKEGLRKAITKAYEGNGIDAAMTESQQTNIVDDLFEIGRRCFIAEKLISERGLNANAEEEFTATHRDRYADSVFPRSPHGPRLCV
jgi:hypothetical protein